MPGEKGGGGTRNFFGTFPALRRALLAEAREDDEETYKRQTQDRIFLLFIVFLLLTKEGDRTVLNHYGDIDSNHLSAEIATPNSNFTKTSWNFDPESDGFQALPEKAPGTALAADQWASLASKTGNILVMK